MCIEFNGKTYIIVEFQHVKPGKGPAFVRTKLKNIETGRTIDNTFTAGVAIEPVRVERRSAKCDQPCRGIGVSEQHTALS